MRTRTIIVVGTIGLAATLGWLVLRSPPSSAPSPLPKPNGYDSFLQAGQMLTSDPGRLDDLSADQLKSLVEENAAALAVARAALRQPCRVALGYSMSYATNHMADLSRLKPVARAFLAEGKLAERDNRPRDAALSYLDAIRFGHECSRGGVIIDMLVGVACQSLGCHALQGVADQLKAADYHEAIQQLEDMDSKAESVTDVANQERAWSRRTFGWRGRVTALVMRRNLQQVADKTLAKLQAQQKTARLLMIELAGRAYELDHGVPPKNINELVPAYLKALPRDPVSPTKVIELPSIPAGRQGGGRYPADRAQRA